MLTVATLYHVRELILTLFKMKITLIDGSFRKDGRYLWQAALVQRKVPIQPFDKRELNSSDHFTSPWQQRTEDC